MVERREKERATLRITQSIAEPHPPTEPTSQDGSYVDTGSADSTSSQVYTPVYDEIVDPRDKKPTQRVESINEIRLELQKCEGTDSNSS